MKPKIFDVTYTATNGTEKHLFVKGMNKAEAIQHAHYNCYTGCDFHNPVEIDKHYTTPRKNGYQGRERNNNK